jgi:lysophospholipase L1-like esterase
MIKLRDSSYNGAYQYSLDNSAFIKLFADVHTTYVLASGLTGTAHTLTFVRRLEGQGFGYTNFQGFAAAPGGTFTLTAQDPRPARKMEFIGDSISTGTGNEGTGGNSPTTENGYMAFGPQIARLCDAEWRVEARGGLGVFHNWNEAYPPAEKHALDYYKQTLFNFDAPAWDFGTWQPDAIVIAFGANDTNGQWNMPASSTVTASYKTSYNDLVDFIEASYPSAQVICMEPIPQWCMQYDGAGTSGGTQTYVKDVVDARILALDTRIHYLQVNTSYSSPLLSYSDYEDGTTHPNVGGDTKVAIDAAPKIKAIMGW